MRVTTRSVVFSFCAALIMGFCQTGFSQSTDKIIQESSIEYFRLYTDEKGESHFDGGHYDLKSKPYTPPAIPFSLSSEIEIGV